MVLLHSAAAILTVISIILTVFAGTKPDRVPLWIPVLLLAVAVLVLAIPA